MIQYFFYFRGINLTYYLQALILLSPAQRDQIEEIQMSSTQPCGGHNKGPSHIFASPGEVISFNWKTIVNASNSKCKLSLLDGIFHTVS